MNGEKNPSQVTQLNSGRDKAALCLVKKRNLFSAWPRRLARNEKAKLTRKYMLSSIFSSKVIQLTELLSFTFLRRSVTIMVLTF